MKKQMVTLWDTALYIRLSREDGDKEESNSVQNQRDLLMSYVHENIEFKLYDIYIDDGFTGTNFDRPNFQKMWQDIEHGKINCVIVKDMSRLGRNHLDVDLYSERYFPNKGVRFIAINDQYDSYTKDARNMDLLSPIKNLLNEQYANDISNKVRSAFETKTKKGDFIGAFACYGYKKSPENHNKLIIDKDVAENVKNVFKWFIEGTSKLSIAFKLNSMGVPCPSEYKKQKGLKYRNANRLEQTVYWTHSTIHRMLKNQMYIGNMVQGTHTTKSFKDKKSVQIDESDWIVVEGTHEPIVDMETWKTAQSILGLSIKKSQYSGEIHLFAGIIKCSDCGRAMVKRNKHDRNHNLHVDYICATYKMYGKENCTSHSIKKETLEKLVLESLNNQFQKYADYEKILNDKEFISKNENKVKTHEQQILNVKSDISKFSNLRDGLYEDFKLEIISQDAYFSLKEKYETRLQALNKQLKNLQQQANDIQDIPTQRKIANEIAKYKNCKTLTRELVVKFVEKIDVFEDGRIRIHYTFNQL